MGSFVHRPCTGQFCTQAMYWAVLDTGHALGSFVYKLWDVPDSLIIYWAALYTGIGLFPISEGLVLQREKMVA